MAIYASKVPSSTFPCFASPMFAPVQILPALAGRSAGGKPSRIGRVFVLRSAGSPGHSGP